MSKTFTITFKGEVTAGELESALAHGLDWYDDIAWEEFTIKEVEANE